MQKLSRIKEIYNKTLEDQKKTRAFAKSFKKEWKQFISNIPVAREEQIKWVQKKAEELI